MCGFDGESKGENGWCRCNYRVLRCAQDDGGETSNRNGKSKSNGNGNGNGSSNGKCNGNYRGPSLRSG